MVDINIKWEYNSKYLDKIRGSCDHVVVIRICCYNIVGHEYS